MQIMMSQSAAHGGVPKLAGATSAALAKLQGGSLVGHGGDGSLFTMGDGGNKQTKLKIKE